MADRPRLCYTFRAMKAAVYMFHPEGPLDDDPRALGIMESLVEALRIRFADDLDTIEEQLSQHSDFGTVVVPFDDFIAELHRIPDPLGKLYSMILQLIDAEDPPTVTRRILAARDHLASQAA